MQFLPPIARVVTLVLAATLSTGMSGSSAAAHEADHAVVAAALPTTVVERETAPFTMVAVTWKQHAPQRVRVSTRSAEAWSPWQELERQEDGPELAAREGSHLLWVGSPGATAVRVEQTGGHEPVDLVLIDTSDDSADSPDAADAAYLADRGGVVAAAPAGVGQDRATLGTEAQGSNAKKNRTGVPKPPVRNRKKWGANEKWRTGPPTFNKKIKQIHIHHTASGNDYRRKDVPGIIRGFYRYHTKSLGWSDIGYNALVDRFGRAWVGRRGGLAKKTRGAHTLGFNHASAGIAVIGTYTDKAPSKKSVRKVARLAAWQLDRHDSRARGKVTVRSKGSTRFGKGRKVKLPIIDGHRHTNHTLCPGQKLFNRLPKIRKIAQRRINRF